MLPWMIALYHVAGKVHQKRRPAGQGLVEYSLILLLMAIVVIGIMTTVGQTICGSWYTQIMNNAVFGGAGTTPCSP
jgi:Flp pilus assembly pilin Flp